MGAAGRGLEMVARRGIGDGGRVVGAGVGRRGEGRIGTEGGGQAGRRGRRKGTKEAVGCLAGGNFLIKFKRMAGICNYITDIAAHKRSCGNVRTAP